MSFELHPVAEEDLENASDYYLSKAGLVIANRFLKEVYCSALNLG